MHSIVHHEGHSIVTVTEAIPPALCSELVARAEGIGFADAPITTGFGFVMAPEVRNNTRVMVDDHALARTLWERLEPTLPARLGPWAIVGLNERFRFYRYEVGQRFAWHRDGAFERPSGERSRLTLMLYLNDDFEGGDTEFDVGERLAVRPETGMALLFSHPVRHQGASVTRGQKYVLRTDVMYRLAPAARS